jgi:ERCC4-type nuclease
MGDYRWRAVVVEGSIDTVLREHAIHQNSVIGAIASFFAWRDVPVLFAGTRLAAARLTFGILRRWEERLRAEKEGRAP